MLVPQRFDLALGPLILFGGGGGLTGGHLLETGRLFGTGRLFHILEMGRFKLERPAVTRLKEGKPRPDPNIL